MTRKTSFVFYPPPEVVRLEFVRGTVIGYDAAGRRCYAAYFA